MCGGAEVKLVCCDAADQPGNLSHEALYGYRASWPPEPSLELLLFERSLNRSPEVNTDPTHSISPVRKMRVTQGYMNTVAMGYVVSVCPKYCSLQY